MKQTKKLVKDYVGAGVMLGAANVAFGNMIKVGGNPIITTKVITPAANAMGTMMTVGMGMNVLNMVNKQTNMQKKKMIKKKRMMY